MQELGVIIGSDHHLEYLIPIWRLIYNKSNHLPVTFFDFGVNESMRSFCKEHFEYICLDEKVCISEYFIEQPIKETWDKFYQKDFWGKREGWFKKALACKYSPYKYTLWIDIDCLVYKDISVIFNIIKKEPFLSLLEDTKSRLDLQLDLNLRKPEEKIYNSGVILFSNNHMIINDWADKSIKENHLFIGDQHALSRSILENFWPIVPLPKEYNWPYNEEKKSDIYIEHFFGLGKKNLLEEVLFFQKIDNI